MKEAINQIRLFLAEVFLGWAVDMSPWNKEGLEIVTMLHSYFDKKVKEQLSSEARKALKKDTQ